MVGFAILRLGLLTKLVVIYHIEFQLYAGIVYLCTYNNKSTSII